MLEGLLEDEHLVLDAYGDWPSFHDAEILWLHLDRNISCEKEFGTPSIRFALHGWEMTSEIDENGYYILRKHRIVEFQFDGLGGMAVDGFNHQNAIFGLRISRVDEDRPERIRVEFEPAHGLAGSFVAVSGRVVSVTPCNEDGIIESDHPGSEQDKGGNSE